MQKSEILEFISKIDSHLQNADLSGSRNRKFELKIFGKSALFLAGLSDSVGTNDIDLLKISSQFSKEQDDSMDARSSRFPQVLEYITKNLIPDYGKINLSYHPEDTDS